MQCISLLQSYHCRSPYAVQPNTINCTSNHIVSLYLPYPEITYSQPIPSVARDTIQPIPTVSRDTYSFHRTHRSRTLTLQSVILTYAVQQQPRWLNLLLGRRASHEHRQQKSSPIKENNLMNMETRGYNFLSCFPLTLLSLANIDLFKLSFV